MAEANLQASNIQISPDTVVRTLAQVRTQMAEDGDDSSIHDLPDNGPVHGNSSNMTVSSDSVMPVNDILKTLNNIAVRFDTFEQQAKLDRERVSKLCEHINSDVVNLKKRLLKKGMLLKKPILCQIT